MEERPYYDDIRKYLIDLRMGGADISESAGLSEAGVKAAAKSSSSSRANRVKAGPPPPLPEGQRWANFLDLREVAADNMELIWADHERPGSPTEARRQVAFGFNRLVAVRRMAYQKSNNLSQQDRLAVLAFRTYGLRVDGIKPEATQDPHTDHRGLVIDNFLRLVDDSEALRGLALPKYGGVALIGSVKIYNSQVRQS